MGRADGTGTRNVRAELQLRFGGSVESASLGMARTDELRFSFFLPAAADTIITSLTPGIRQDDSRVVRVNTREEPRYDC